MPAVAAPAPAQAILDGVNARSGLVSAPFEVRAHRAICRAFVSG
jgi:hypothetical protein